MGTCKTPLPSHIEQATVKIFSFTSFNIVQLLWQIWMFKTKITFLKIQWSISTFCPTVFKNSPKCPNDDQMLGKTVNLTNEFRRAQCQMILSSYGQNSLNLCTSQDWISKIVADIWKLIGSTDALQIFLLLYIHLKIVEHSSGKKKRNEDFQKIFQSFIP